MHGPPVRCTGDDIVDTREPKKLAMWAQRSCAHEPFTIKICVCTMAGTTWFRVALVDGCCGLVVSRCLMWVGSPHGEWSGEVRLGLGDLFGRSYDSDS